MKACVCAIVQARMASERLPGKVLIDVMGKPLLQHELERLGRARTIERVVVATTTNPLDEAIVSFCKRVGVKFFRGPEADVLARYAGAARQENAGTVVRVTADCPLIDPAVVDRAVSHYLERKGDVDYVSNILERTYPRGMDCEVFSADTLHEAEREAKETFEREHVTPFIYRHPERYRLEGVKYDRDESAHRWTVDTPEDLELARRMLETLLPSKPEFTLEDALRASAEHPEWADLNRHVAQKTFENTKGQG